MTSDVSSNPPTNSSLFPVNSQSSTMSLEDASYPLPTISIYNLKLYAEHHFSRPCVTARRIADGYSSLIYLLSFSKNDSLDITTSSQEEWSCIAKIKKRVTPPEVLQAEIDTMQYIRAHTAVPVPDVYAYDLNPDNDIGAQFMLIEKLPGKVLYWAWDELSLENKISVISELAQALVELSSLHFDAIGSIQGNGQIGPLYHRTPGGGVSSMGPFTSTLDYLLGYVPDSPHSPDNFKKARNIIKSFMESNTNTTLSPPYRIIHPDFHAFNVFVYQHGETAHLSGIIDWEFAYTAPVNFLYDYPPFICNDHDQPECWAENRILRRRFVEVISDLFAKGSRPAMEFALSMQKNFQLNGFYNKIIFCVGDNCFEEMVKNYVLAFELGIGRPYEDGPDDDEAEFLLSALNKSRDDEMTRRSKI